MRASNRFSARSHAGRHLHVPVRKCASAAGSRAVRLLALVPGCMPLCAWLPAVTAAAIGCVASDASRPRSRRSDLHGRLQASGQPALRRRLRGPGEGLLQGPGASTSTSATPRTASTCNCCWPARSSVTTANGAQVLQRNDEGLPLVALALIGQKSEQGFAVGANSGISSDQGLGGQDFRLQGHSSGRVPGDRQGRRHRPGEGEAGPRRLRPARSQRGPGRHPRRVRLERAGHTRPHRLQDEALRPQRLRRARPGPDLRLDPGSGGQGPGRAWSASFARSSRASSSPTRTVTRRWTSS